MSTVIRKARALLKRAFCDPKDRFIVKSEDNYAALRGKYPELDNLHESVHGVHMGLGDIAKLMQKQEHRHYVDKAQVFVDTLNMMEVLQISLNKSIKDIDELIDITLEVAEAEEMTIERKEADGQ